MANGKMRVSKTPQERKQEIMDTAMGVFSEKGYEQTTMRDIAAAVGVVPGLCYRYFGSKQELFQEAVALYAADYCAPIVRLMRETEPGGSFDGIMSCAAQLFMERDGGERYHDFFHKKENREFHILMSHAICEYMQPFVKELMDRLNESGAIKVTDTASCSRFLLYGQIGIISDEQMTAEERAEAIKRYCGVLIGGIGI